MTPQDIAKGLSEGEREVLLEAHDEGDDTVFLPTSRRRSAVHESLYTKGLLFIVWRGAMLNETGLAVRSILQEGK